MSEMEKARFEHLMGWLLEAQVEAEGTRSRHDRKCWLEITGIIVRMMARPPRITPGALAVYANGNGAANGAVSHQN